MNKKNIAVLFGGQSSEHEVSCMSVVNVAEHINKEEFNIILIGITKDGHWVSVENIDKIKDGTWVNGKIEAVLSPDAGDQSVLLIDGTAVKKIKIDVAFPVLHGLYGEDGTVQGLFELARMPYVGCGVLASAVSMDKLYTKIIVDSIGIRQAAYIGVLRHELKKMDQIIEKVENKFSYPVFIKPSNAGSSKGVSRADDREALVAGLLEAAKHDCKILVEETIVGREIECAVFGGGNTAVKASGVGEILAAAEFYDFDAKYNNAESKTVVNPVLPGNAAEEVRKAAIEIFKAVDGCGLSRVDFFVKEDGEIVFNEINTLPGFTAISMYPMLWEAAGVDKDTLIADLIKHGMNRFAD